MSKILFVCTGNYYRSRFAELLYNALARKQKLDSQAFSRGLGVYKARNKGPISVLSLQYLEQIGIALPEKPSDPVQFVLEDFQLADRTILLDRTEHLPMLQAQFPDLVTQVEFWDFPDVQFESHELILPALEQKVRALFDEQ